LADLRRAPLDGSSLVILLSAMAAMNALSVEIILPAIVPISRDLLVSESAAAMLIGGYFMAYGVGQMLWGLLSDAFGRRAMLLLGMTGFLFASIGAAMATDFTTLMVFRVAQGVLGASPVIANAIVRDISSGQQAARTQSVLSAVISIAPLMAPAVGSGLLVMFSWRIIFLFLALVSAALIVTAYVRLPETLAEKQLSRLHPGFIARRTKELFSNQQFRTGALVMSLTFSGFASLLTMGSVVLENAYDIPPEAFGSVYMIVAAATLLGVLLARAMLKTQTLLVVGKRALMVLSVAVLLHVCLLFTTPGFPLFWSIIFIYLFAFGMVFPTFTSYGLEAAGNSKGFAASLIGAMNMTGGFLTSLLVTALYDGSFRAISYSMIFFGAAAILIFAADRLKRG